MSADELTFDPLASELEPLTFTARFALRRVLDGPLETYLVRGRFDLLEALSQELCLALSSYQVSYAPVDPDQNGRGRAHQPVLSVAAFRRRFTELVAAPAASQREPEA